MRRILVTGSRLWEDYDAVDREIFNAIHDHPHEPSIIVHGGCKSGADWFADRVCIAHGIPRETHPVEWRPYGIYNPQAGLARNRKMVELGANLCLAFIRAGSPGASHCARLAEEASIETRRFTA